MVRAITIAADPAGGYTDSSWSIPGRSACFGRSVFTAIGQQDARDLRPVYRAQKNATPAEGWRLCVGWSAYLL